MRSNIYVFLLVISVAASSSFLRDWDWKISDIRKPYAPLDGRWLPPGGDYSCTDARQPFIVIEGDEWKIVSGSGTELLFWKDVWYEYSSDSVVVHAMMKMGLFEDNAEFEPMSFEFADNGDTLEMVRVFSDEVSLDIEIISKNVRKNYLQKLTICERTT